MADKRLDQTTNASAVAAADNIPFVTAAGVTSYVTGDELAASGPFSSRYKPLASDSIWIPASAFSAVVGSPTLGNLGAATDWTRITPAFLFDASAGESATAYQYVPPSWASFNVFVWWSNAGTGSGDVAWQVYWAAFADAENTDTAGGTSNLLTVAAPARYVTKRTQAGASAVTATAGEIVRIVVHRSGSAGGDTLANDAGLIGVELVRVS